MNDRITYAVVYRPKADPEEWREFSPWFESYEEARIEAREAKRNARFLEVKIVERVETFQFVG